MRDVAERVPWFICFSDCFSGSSSRQASVTQPGKAFSRLKVTAGLWEQR